MKHTRLVFAFLLSWSTLTQAQWVESTAGIPASTLVYSFGTSGSNLFAGSLFGVYVSTNSGSNWNAANNGIPAFTIIRTTAFIGGNILAGGRGGVYLSTNNGANWATANVGRPPAEVWALLVDGSTVFSGGDSGVYVSTNNGSSWSPARAGLPTGNFSTVTAITRIGASMVAGTTSFRAYVSTNNGANWTAANNGLPSPIIVTSFAVLGNNLFLGGSKGTYLSTNSGSTWDSVNTGQPPSLYVNSMTTTGNNLFIAANNGASLSTDMGATWAVINSGLPSSPFLLTIAISGSKLFCGLAGNVSVWSRPLSDFGISTGVAEFSPHHPAEFALSQNFPNPFNPGTTISFSIAHPGYVTLKVFDILGGEVASLVDGMVDAGRHDVRWDANVAGGVYMYRLVANGYASARKMVYLK